MKNLVLTIFVLCLIQSNCLKAQCSLTSDFYFVADTVYVDQEMHFLTSSDTSCGYSYQWAFNYGTPDTSSLPYPVSVWDSAGVFQVQCIVSNGYESDTAVQSVYVLSLGGCVCHDEDLSGCNLICNSALDYIGSPPTQDNGAFAAGHIFNWWDDTQSTSDWILDDNQTMGVPYPAVTPPTPPNDGFAGMKVLITPNNANYESNCEVITTSPSCFLAQNDHNYILSFYEFNTSAPGSGPNDPLSSLELDELNVVLYNGMLTGGNQMTLPALNMSALQEFNITTSNNPALLEWRQFIACVPVPVGVDYERMVIYGKNLTWSIPNSISMFVDQVEMIEDDFEDQEYTICNGEIIEIGSQCAITNMEFLWNTSETTGLITVNPSTTTTYTLTRSFASSGTYGNDHSCAEGSIEITVNVNANPTVDAGNNQTVSCGSTFYIGGSPTASGNGPFTYAWSPGTFLNSTSIANPQVQNITANTTYTVTVTDDNGCTASDFVTITISSYCNPSTSGTTYWVCEGTTITSNTTWSTYDYIIIQGQLNVSATLTIQDATVLFMQTSSSCGGILVNGSSSCSSPYKLVLDGCTVRAGCNYLWDKIEAYNHNAQVDVINGTVIQDAQYGLYTTRGGVFNIYGGSIIKNCAVGAYIEILGSVTLPSCYNCSGGVCYYPGNIYDAKFTDDAALLAIPPGNPCGMDLCDNANTSPMKVDASNIMSYGLYIYVKPSKNVTFDIGESSSGDYYTTVFENCDKACLFSRNANLNIVNTKFWLDPYAFTTPFTPGGQTNDCVSSGGSTTAGLFGIQIDNDASMSGSSRVMDIGGTGTKNGNRFVNLHQGISASTKSEGHIWYNSFKDCVYSSIYLTTSVIETNIISDTIDVTGISDAARGIWCHNNNDGTLNIDENLIYLNYNSPQGIRLSNSTSPTQSGHYRMDLNYIVAGKRGIEVASHQHVQISNNAITLTYAATSGYNDEYIGILTTGCKASTIQSNSIYKDYSSTSNGEFWGIDIHSPSGGGNYETSYICENIMSHSSGASPMERGLVLEGSQINSSNNPDILNNVFNDCDISIYLDAADIGPQGKVSPEEACDNLWINSDPTNQPDTHAANGGGLTSIFNYSGANYSGNTDYKNENNTNDGGSFAIQSNQLTDGSPNYCATLPYQRLNGDLSPEMALVAEALADSTFTGNTLWLRLQSIYQTYVHDLYLQEQDTLLAQFIDSLANEPIGRFEEIDNLLASSFDTSTLTLDSSVIFDALALNNSIEPTFYIEEINQIVNDIGINEYLNGNLTVDSTQMDALLEIAHLCPLQYGSVVFDARVMLDVLMIPNLNYDDETCDNSVGLRNPNPEGENFKVQAINFKLYPNPASNYVELTWNKSLESGNCLFELYNVMGTRYEIVQLPIDAKEMTIGMDELVSGIYFYFILDSNKVLDQGKLIILK